jgi:hypothetical protein
VGDESFVWSQVLSVTGAPEFGDKFRRRFCAVDEVWWQGKMLNKEIRKTIYGSFTRMGDCNG